jgi:putative NADPH-quinone reductase
MHGETPPTMETMRFLVIYAHPVEESFQSALHRCVVDTLIAAGHEVDDCDLYAENFQPVLSARERRAYHSPTPDIVSVAKDIERLRGADGLVFVFPTWWFGMPAILKGYIDRVWVPGVAFELRNGQTLPLLRQIRRFGVITTYGSPWWLNKLVFRDPNRHALMHGLRYLVSRQARTRWLALYGMDHRTDSSRRKFLRKVEQCLRRF